METNTKDQVKELRDKRQTANAVYMKFTEDWNDYTNYVFCFFEGEDAKYYNTRIKRYFAERFMTYTVGNKKEVIKLLRKLESDSLYEQVIKMFFVDRDADESLAGISSDLYETPCYSIENLYAQKECFEDIIQSEFGINRANKDFNKCVADFENRFIEFMEGMEEYNALIKLRRQKSDANSDVKFGDIKTTHLLNITIDGITKSHRYQEKIDNIKFVIGVTSEEVQKSVLELRNDGNAEMCYRGKNQLDFFCAFLKLLKELNDKGNYFSEKYNCVKLNLTSNRLSELSQYALTPKCLEKFLQEHVSLIAS